MLLTAAASTEPSPGLLALVLVALVLWWGWNVLSGRRAARTCERYGHVPDPGTIGTRRERCVRCGLRLR